MKSEDLLKAIGEIDEKFIEEASPQIKPGNENLSIVSDEIKEHNTIKLSEAKPKSMFRIIAPIAACLCVIAIVGVAVINLSKPKIQPNSDVSVPSAAKAESQNKVNDSSGIEGLYNEESSFEVSEEVNSAISEESNAENSTAPQVSKPDETSEAVTSNTEPSYSEESSYYEESPLVSTPDVTPDPNAIITVSTKISSSDVKAITAGMTYQEIINQLGETANFGHPGLRQYIVDDELILVLRFDNLTDVCTETGEDLLRSAVSYKAPERISEQLNAENTVYGIVIDDGFISCIGDEYSDCYYLGLADADIKFGNGESAAANDISLMSCVIVTFDRVAESYPPQAHCTSVTIIDSPYVECH